MDNIKTIDTTVETVTINIPVDITMSAVEDVPMEFTASIDELGRIVLTPVSTDAEFVDVCLRPEENTDITDHFEKNIVTVDNSTRILKQTSIVITANMLLESPNQELVATTDEIGQIVISPISDKNVFLTASFEESLNLVTEDMQVVEYFGYKLVNTGDGWNVTSPDNKDVEEGVATLSEAKILVLETELRALRGLNETIETSSEVQSPTEESELDKEVEPDVDAEVITEHTSEEYDTHDIITRFMQGDVALFSDEGTPSDSYVHLKELDAKGYSYYYDKESDIVVSYPTLN